MLSRQYKNHHQKGVAAVIGFVILIALAATTSIVVVGMAVTGPIDSLENQSQQQQVKNTFSQMSSSSVSAAIGGKYSSKTVDLDFATPSKPVQVSEQGSIKVWKGSDSSTPIIQEQLGYIKYESDQKSTMYYQNGAVWRIYDNGTVVSVTPPEFHYRNQTLTLPLVKITSTKKTYTSSVEFTYSGGVNTSEQVHVDGKDIHIVITGPTYLGWGQYFENRVGEEAVTYMHDKNKVRADFEISRTRYIDTFNSALVGSSGLQMQPHSTVDGTVKATNLETKNDSMIKGDLFTSDNNVKAEVTGSIQSNTETLDLKKLDGLINSKIREAQSSGTILGSVTITSSRTFDEGTYYMTDLTVSGGDVTIDASDGNVEFVVDGSVSLDDTHVNVIVDDSNDNDGTTSEDDNKSGEFEIFTNGDYIQHTDSYVNQGGDARNVFLYATSSSFVKFYPHSEFVGVVYAPSSSSGSQYKTSGGSNGSNGGGNNCDVSNGTVCIKPHATIKGAVYSGKVSMLPHSTINYDENLATYETQYESEYAFSGNGIKAAYIHASITNVKVSGGSDT